tara:strand:- start:2799 stop:3050 length:252 start_codon:yes stop_codon:yes gene_type:complete
MAKIIAEKTQEVIEADAPKVVEIKHTRTMQDASGKDVEVVDYVETQDINQAISQCEVRKADLEAQLTDCEAELADYVAIRDAE